MAYGQNTAQPDDSGPLDGARPDPCLEDPRRHAPAHPDGSPCPCDGPTTSSSTPSFHTIHARTRAGSVGVVTSSMASCSKVRERGSFSAALGTSVMTRDYRTNVREKVDLRRLGGDPGGRSGAISRLGGDQRRQRLRSDLSSGGWMVTRCDAGAVAGPAGLKTQRAGRRQLGLTQGTARPLRPFQRLETQPRRIRRPPSTVGASDLLPARPAAPG